MAAEVSERLQGKKFFAGHCTFTSITLPTGPSAGVGDPEVREGAKIAASKLRRRMSKIISQGNVAAATETRVIHIAYGAVGEVLGFRVGNIVRATGDSTLVVNLRKNGVTILAANVTLDATHPGAAGYGVVDGVLSGTVGILNLAADDILDVVFTATAGTGTLPTGAFAEVVLDEDPG